MDFYMVLKLVHVLGAIAWVGGGATLLTAAIVAGLRNDEAGSASALRLVVALSNIWFIPASLVTVLAGVGMAILYGLWSEAWIVIGLAGFAMTFSIGVAILKPLAEKADAASNAGDTAAAAIKGAAMLDIAKFDYTMLTLVVAAMVLKPGWGDVATFAVMVVILVAAGLAFLRRGMRASRV